MSVETEIVTISITQDTVALARAGFGTALVLSHNATFPERVRYYGGIDEIAVDFSSTSPEYRTALAYFGQSEKPERLAVGRATGAVPTLQYTIGQAALRNSDAASYKINVVGQGFSDAVASYTSDSTATAAEIHNGLVTSLNAVSGKNYTATFAPLSFVDFTVTCDNTTDQLNHTAHGLSTGDGPVRISNSGGGLPTGLSGGTDYWVIKVDADNFQLATSLANALAGTAVNFTTDGTGTQTINHQSGTLSPILPFLVTGNAPGNWFSLELVDVSALTSKISSAGDPTSDLDAIELEQPDWYCLLTNYNGKTYVQNCATWIEAHTKIYLADVPETDSINVVVGSGTDTLAALHTAAFGRTAGSYHHRPATMMSAAWAGRVLPVDPGGDTWALKLLVGTSMPSKLTSTQRVNLRARKANFITLGFGKNITFDGTTADGDFIDVTRGLDWLNDDMTKRIGGSLLSVNKIPFTDAGIAVIVGDVHASLDIAIQRGILRGSPEPVVTAPQVADIDDSDKALRLLPDIEFSGQLAGAIHKVHIAGKVSV